MDYVTRQFIKLAKKLRDDARKGLSSLRIELHHIKDAIETVNKNAQARDEKEHTQKEIIAVLHTPEAIETKRQGHEDGTKRRDRIRLVVEWLTFLAVVFYGYMAVRQWREMISVRHQAQSAIVAATRSATAAENANQTAREQFREEQRPYIWNQAGHPATLGDNKIAFNMFYANFGKTPALELRSIGRVFFGENARQEGHQWIEKMRKGSLESRDMSVAVVAPGAPTDFEKMGYFVTATSEKIPTKDDLDSFKTKDFRLVIAVRIEYFGTDRARRYSSDICFESLVNGTMGYCHYNDNHVE